MRRSKTSGCRQVYRLYAKQTYPKTRFLYHRSTLHSLRGCACGSLHAAAEPQAPPAQAPPPAPAKAEPAPAPAPAPVAVKPAPVAVKPAPAQVSRSAARIIVSYIHFLGSVKRTQADEFIELKNVGAAAQDLSGWRVSAADPGQNFTFPAGTSLEPGAVTRIYTDLANPEPGHFSFRSKRAIWNDSGDLGQLFDDSGAVVAQYGYGSFETRTVASIKEACGVPMLQIIVEPEQLAEQEKHRSRVDFLTALERALRSLIQDPADSERPNLATAVRSRWGGSARLKPSAIQELVREHLHGQKLYLHQETNLPEGISARKSWVFRLKDELGDRVWIVVDRSGAEPAYQQLV